MLWIIWLVFICEESYRNYRLIDRGVTIKHWTEGLIRIAVATAIILLVNPPTWTHVVCWYLGAFFSFWLLFNILLNWFRGKPFGYVGKGSWLDRLENLSPSVIMPVFAKAVLAAGFIYGYYQTNLF